MTLVLKNLQNIVKLRLPQIEKDIQSLRRLMSIENYDVSVLFVSNKHIQKLNRDYRQTDGPTDVLAFPALETAEPGVLPAVGEEAYGSDNMQLGDLLLAPAYISHQCQCHKDHFDHVLLTTVTHGLCHLIGYDHETVEQQHQMIKVEHSILDRFNRLTGYSCRPLTVLGH